MTKNPVFNAIVAAVYISIVSTVMSHGAQWFGQKDTAVTPVLVLSLFVLSAAVMGFIFLYQPLQLYFSDKKQAGVKLFLQTVGVFAVFTLIIFAVMFSMAR